MSRIAVLGFGSFGTALGIMLAKRGHEVAISARKAAAVREAAETRINSRYLPDAQIPVSVALGTDAAAAVPGADIVLFAVPAQHFREKLNEVKGNIKADTICVNVAKGIEEGTLLRMSQIAAEEAPGLRYVALSGPSHAEEVAAALPTIVAVSSRDNGAQAAIQREFITKRFRVYTNDDLTGVELGGALKNIMAIGAGASDGLGFGDNAKAALMTRGIAEISRLGTALGGDPKTFAGITGIGDLIVTCTSMHSRNRRCGMLIGQGFDPAEAEKKIGMVVEGVSTCNAAVELSRQMDVEMPISQAIWLCLHGRLSAPEAISRLMGRAAKDEINSYA